MLHEFALSVVASAGAVASAASAGAIRFTDLGLDPVVFRIGWFALRWYSLAYIAGIVLGWWYLSKLLKQPGAPMAQRHADDFVFYATLGIILGGRLGYVLFYKPEMLGTPTDIIKLWEGGMSFHGGLIGLVAAILYFAWKNKLPLLRVLDYVGCATPFGEFFVRLANFVNGELWGRPTDLPWGIVFPGGGDVARHPSQLYEAGLEGLGLGLLLWWLFWKTDARYYPGRLAGAGLTFYALVRFGLERVRAPDAGLEHLSWGLTMGQTLSLPVLLVGLWLLTTSKGRRHRIEPIAGNASVA
ncbi:prolipoprotein diacylglyceryl transferase [Sphingomonas sp. SUN039]|uniref:prolipoprotein diacylglyceryl transferase n=1 Tax=Sphingomonas sp. SUN039 TaxID=2937787 RepID=UPI002164AD6C|nr:prolipoprotein diacylglyceryl transferase [Sphingomonas sp. SUN039]UVO54753.1 prolipoprotein diacylglyceryl transferase [Sphingomonas sp. SUN039]